MILLYPETQISSLTFSSIVTNHPSFQGLRGLTGHRTFSTKTGAVGWSPFPSIHHLMLPALWCITLSALPPSQSSPLLCSTYQTSLPTLCNTVLTASPKNWFWKALPDHDKMLCQTPEKLHITCRKKADIHYMAHEALYAMSLSVLGLISCRPLPRHSPQLPWPLFVFPVCSVMVSFMCQLRLWFSDIW